MNEKELQVHELLVKYLGEYIPVQELTHAARIIGKTIVVDEEGTITSYSEDAIYDAHTYLQQADREFTPLQTVNTKSLTNNQIILAMNDIRKALA